MALRTITRTERHTHNYSGRPHAKPFGVVCVAGCVHEIVSEQPVGAQVECDQCGDLAPKLERIREFVASDRYSHAVTRSTAANRCLAWSHYFFYYRDPKSPTQCGLEFSAPHCDEVRDLLAELQTRVVPGPSRGAMAML